MKYLQILLNIGWGRGVASMTCLRVVEHEKVDYFNKSI